MSTKSKWLNKTSYHVRSPKVMDGKSLHGKFFKKQKQSKGQALRPTEKIAIPQTPVPTCGPDSSLQLAEPGAAVRAAGQEPGTDPTQAQQARTRGTKRHMDALCASNK